MTINTFRYKHLYNHLEFWALWAPDILAPMGGLPTSVKVFLHHNQLNEID